MFLHEKLYPIHVCWRVLAPILLLTSADDVDGTKCHQGKNAYLLHILIRRAKRVAHAILFRQQDLAPKVRRSSSAFRMISSIIADDAVALMRLSTQSMTDGMKMNIDGYLRAERRFLIVCIYNLTIKEMSNGKCAALNALGSHGSLNNAPFSSSSDTQFEESVRVRGMLKALSSALSACPSGDFTES